MTQSLPTPSAPGLKDLRAALAAWVASAWLLRPVVRLVVAMLLRMFDQLEMLLAKFQAGTLPAPRPRAPKIRAAQKRVRDTTPRTPGLRRPKQARPVRNVQLRARRPSLRAKERVLPSRRLTAGGPKISKLQQC